MARRRADILINGISAREAEPRIIIREIEEEEPEADILTADIAGRNGIVIRNVRWKQRRIILRFAVREIRDLTARADAFRRIAAWAEGEKLQISSRPGMHLDVYRTGMPTPGPIRDYTAEGEITWTTAGPPWWKNDISEAALATGKSGTAILHTGGTAEEPLNALITAEAALNTITISCNGYSMSLSGLGISEGGKLEIGHGRDGVLYIRSGSTGKISCRSAASDDEIMLQPGQKNSISFTGNASCTWEFTAEGWNQ